MDNNETGPREIFDNARELIDLTAQNAYGDWVETVAPQKSKEEAHVGSMSLVEAEVALSALIDKHNEALEMSDFGMAVTTHVVIQQFLDSHDSLREAHEKDIERRKKQMEQMKQMQEGMEQMDFGQGGAGGPFGFGGPGDF